MATIAQGGDTGLCLRELSVPGLSVPGNRNHARLHPISHQFNPGLCALVGPNGAGKSTLLRAIAGLEKASGVVALDGEQLLPAAGDLVSSQRLAYLPQQSGLQFSLLVAEVVELAFINWPLSLQSRRQYLQQVAEAFDLQALWQQAYTQLSGGQQARVQLARVYAQLLPAIEQHSKATQVLLLDEPVAALDIPYQHKMLRLLQHLSSQVSVLVILHDINLALRYADSALLLKQGRKVAGGSAAAVLTQSNLQTTFDADIALVRQPGLDYFLAVFQ